MDQSRNIITSMTPSTLAHSMIIWDDIRLDFIEGFPTSNSKNSILVVVDRLSKFAHFMALAHPYMTKVITEFIEGVVHLHAMAQTTIGD